MATDIRNICARYVAVSAEAKRLEQEKNDLKTAILAHLGDKTADVTGGFAIKLTPGVRKTLSATLVESNLGITIPDTCYKSTSYNSLAVTKISA